MKFNKLTSLFLTTILSTTIIAGCGQKASADDMLNPPKAPIEADAIEQAIKQKYGSDVSLIVPPSTQDLQAINFIDFDGDNKEEAIVFFKIPNDQNKIKGIILKNNNNKIELYEGINGIGKEIEKVNFDDIDNNKKQEIYISWQPESSFDVGFGTYDFDGSKINTLKEGSIRSWFLGDLDNDSTNELYIYNEERENMDNPNTRLERYKLINNKLSIIDTCPIDEFAYGPESVIFGNALDNQKGLFMDISNGNSGFTSLITLKDGKMNNVFYDSTNKFTEKTFKQGPTPSFDINHDGIVEISIPAIAKGYENEAMAFMVYVTEWFKWDGKEGLVHVMDTYDNYEMNLRLNLSDGWKENIKIEKNSYDSKDIFVSFFYEDSSTKELLFDIQYVTPDKSKEMEDRGYSILGLDNKNIYYIKLNSEIKSTEAKKFQLTLEEIKNRFSKFTFNNIF